MNIIAEVGQAHEGSLTEAMSYVDACADAGVWGVKFQRHIPGHDPCKDFRPGIYHPQDATRDAYWQRTGFSWDHWHALAERCRQRRLHFGLSVFDSSAIRDVEAIVDFWKIPSALALSRSIRDVLQQCERKQPVFVSCGLFDGRTASSVWRDYRGVVWYLHCVPEYPTALSKMGMSELALVDGVSLHYPGIAPGIHAAEYGARWCEVHVIKDRRYSHVPDATSSLEFAELRQLVEIVREIRQLEAPGDPENVRKESRERYARAYNYGGPG